MWQPIIAGLLVIAAALYVARALGPRRWRRREGGAGTKAAGSSLVRMFQGRGRLSLSVAKHSLAVGRTPH